MNIETARLEVSITKETRERLSDLSDKTGRPLGNLVDSFLRNGMASLYKRHPNLRQTK